MEPIALDFASSIDPTMLTAVLDEILALVPKVLPVIIAFIGFRKALAFVKDALYGA